MIDDGNGNGDRNGSLERFSGFADLYDANRPSAPARLGSLLARYANVARPEVVDLGSGTGLSSRWAAGWAASVVGVEPNPEMRALAESRPTPGVVYRHGASHETGLADRSADVVVAVQAFHWMEPISTLAEVARLLRPGGVFAAVDADWPPVSGNAAAEVAWGVLHRRIRVLEARAARGDVGDTLRAPISDDDPALVDDDLADPHRNRAMPGGVRSWSKTEHLARLVDSGHFALTRELMFDEPAPGGAERFVALMRSQGSYQGLRRLGLTDAEIGMDVFERDAHAAFTAAFAATPAVTESPLLGFSWRVRLGSTPYP